MPWTCRCGWARLIYIRVRCYSASELTTTLKFDHIPDPQWHIHIRHLNHYWLFFKDISSVCSRPLFHFSLCFASPWPVSIYFIYFSIMAPTQLKKHLCARATPYLQATLLTASLASLCFGLVHMTELNTKWAEQVDVRAAVFSWKFWKWVPNQLHRGGQG